MRKTTIELDEQLLAEVQEVLHTRGIKDTVHRAFEEILTLEARRLVIERLKTMDGLDLDKPEVMARAWR